MTETAQVLSIAHIVGAVLLGTTAGLATLAGLGGGGLSVVTLIIFFDILPKEATIIVFSCILGSSLPNLCIQMRKTFNGQPVVNYKFAFLSCPLIFLGTLIGVFMNNWLPSAAVVLIIISQAIQGIPKMYKRFKASYKKQSQKIQEHKENKSQKDIIQVSTVNPFACKLNIRIFKQLFLFITAFIVLSMCRGTNKFPSLIGVSSCSPTYWVLTALIFSLTVFFHFWNNFKLKKWTNSEVNAGELSTIQSDVIQKNKQVQIQTAVSVTKTDEPQQQNVVEKNKKQFIQSSILAGFFSGFGRGGGVYLVPLYQTLGLASLQASATCTFSVFITSIINVIQAIVLGVLSLSQFFTYFSMSFAGSLFFSMVVADRLRKANRLSYVQLIMTILLTLSSLLLPFSLWMKYYQSGNDQSVVFGFGSIC